MVIGIHRVMSLCVIVLLTESIFGSYAMATDNRVKDLAKQAGVRILQDSTSDKTLQKTAASQVPLQQMSQRSRQRATHLLDNTSQYRRMPTLQYEVDASLYQYLINHPDVAIATWRVMGISKLNMWQTAPFEYSAEATDGSKGSADVLWRDANQCLFVVEGAYHSPLLPGAIEASALVWLRYRFQRTSDNRILVSQQIETFVNFPSAAIEAIAKLAAMVTNSILDRNVMEVSLYAQMMSRAVDKDPRWVEEVADRLDGVPEYRKIELARVAHGMNPYKSPQGGQMVAGNQSQARDQQGKLPAALTMSSLSDSKRQLLHAVRSEKVVMIVKPGPEQSRDTSLDESSNGNSVTGIPLGSAIRAATKAKQVSLVDSPSENVNRGTGSDVATSGVATSDAAISKQYQKPTYSPSIELDQQLAGTGPTRKHAVGNQATAGSSGRTGHLKDSSFTSLPNQTFSTGPVRSQSSPKNASRKTSENGDRTKTAHDVDATKAAATLSEVVSSHDQPALVVLPAATAL